MNTNNYYSITNGEVLPTALRAGPGVTETIKANLFFRVNYLSHNSSYEIGTVNVQR